MRYIPRTYLVLVFFLAGFFPAVSAQFYNGMQMTFGKNRVQYNTFYWKYYRFERFDVYSYENGTDLSLYVADFVEKELDRIERMFDYDIEKRLIFICYNKMTDFRQSNIGLITGEDDYNIGGTTKINQNKVFLYFNGNHLEFEEQIRAAIAEILINELLFGNGVRDNVTSSTVLKLPDWYLKGLISYVANPWDYELENRVKDGLTSGKYIKFKNLTDEDAVYAGHSFWKYVADLYGPSIIPSILYITKVNKNAETGFLYVLGSKMKDLSVDWTAYYLGVYSSEEENKDLPQEGELLKHPKKRLVYQNLRLSPDGTKLAYVTNDRGRYTLWLFDQSTGKRRKILRKEHKLDQITDYSFPVITWHPTGELLSYITEEKGFLKINYYNLETRDITSRNLLNFEKILDMSFSPDGRKLVFSAVVNGQTDIWVYDIASSTNEQITNDLADDFQPRFINKMNEITFISNRRTDTLYTGSEPEYSTTTASSVYVYNYKTKSSILRKLSEGPYFGHSQALSLGNNRFVYLSDKNGIVNRYFAKYDSAISYIDTVVHYRYFANSYPLSNYRRNIIDQDLNPVTRELSEIVFHDGRYHLYSYPVETQKLYGDKLEQTEYSRQHTKQLMEYDSTHHVEKIVVSMKDIVDNKLVYKGDTIKLQEFKIDINKYIFEREKLNYYNNELQGRHLNLVMDTASNDTKVYIDYRTSFYPDQLVNQVDFSFLSASYQAFTGSAFYYNPGMNLLFKVGANDLFEDYRLIGGVRFATDFDSNEYLLSFENLKSRLDKQLIFHRQVFKSTTETSTIKTFSHELMGSLRFPFSQVASLKATASFRHDNTIYLASDLSNLNEPNLLKVWSGIKLEYIFDNTFSLGTNLYSGMRMKLFAEAYRQLNAEKSDLYVAGCDIRYYVRLHRDLIWASRFASSTSFGRSPLIYYLGGVDDWTNLFPNRWPTFDESVDIDYEKNYSYQAIATNLRGFSQNIRNGNNFALINTELRWPVIRYFANHPLSSSFLNDFQVVAFADVGSAWTGLHPFTGENAWDYETYENGPITVKIDSNRGPIVAGYGLGLRTRVFGYFIRLDWAWGVENWEVQPRIFYLSLSLDF